MTDPRHYEPPPSDPEAEGLPATADDDSLTDAAAGSAREADGRDPAALPGGREWQADRYGTTAEEQRLGEPMDLRLAQEQPDITAVRPASEPLPPVAADSAADDDEPRLGPDDEIVGVSADPLLDASLEGAQARPDTEVSLYDDLDQQAGSGRVGRLVAPDEGAHGDDEADEIATDVEAGEGGLSAEEAAMHEDPNS